MNETLHLAEAVPLGYAVLARVADDVGVRMLAIKGPILALQGLREPHQSVDIDVLVEPAGLQRLTDRLESLGWHDGGSYTSPGIVPLHSVNHRHPCWPCELDVHYWFPGFLANASDVFDVLWERRLHLDLAHHVVLAPDRAGHAAIAALHYLRDEGQGTKRVLFDDLVERVRCWSSVDLQDLASLAAETGASESLEPLLDGIGAPKLASTRPLVTPLSDWRMRSQTRTTVVLPWIVGLRRTTWWRRPVFVWRAVFLDARQFRAPGESQVPKGRALAAARWQRIKRAARMLPAGLANYRRLRGPRRG